MNDNDGMLPIPDELMESFAGGVLSDHERQVINQTAATAMDQGIPSESVIKMFETLSERKGRTEDMEEITKIVLWVYGE